MVTADELAGGELAPRLEALEISPSGPLWGAGMTRPGPAVEEVELEALQAMGVTPRRFAPTDPPSKGARRPLRVPLFRTATDSGVDEFGPYVRVAFDLPAGAYATVLLRELMKAPEPEAPLAST
jgi:tRNA pseudouridine13 synthase